MTCTLPSLWQRFGCTAHNKELTGTALLFAEKEHFNDEQVAKAARKAQREATGKRTAKEANLLYLSHTLKHPMLSPFNQDTDQTFWPGRNGGNTLLDEDQSDDNDNDQLPTSMTGENILLLRGQL